MQSMYSNFGFVQSNFPGIVTDFSGLWTSIDKLEHLCYTLCTRLYAQRRVQRKTEQILKELEASNGDEKGHHPPQARSCQPAKTR